MIVSEEHLRPQFKSLGHFVKMVNGRKEVPLVELFEFCRRYSDEYINGVASVPTLDYLLLSGLLETKTAYLKDDEFYLNTTNLGLLLKRNDVPVAIERILGPLVDATTLLKTVVRDTA